jgi:RNA polymerase sigma-70 factor (ECF subfamily)
MAGGQASPVQRFLSRLRAVGAGDPADDGALLRRFVAGGDEAAFAALVGRHGPMVLGVCRRLLGDAQDAEDAFQATFLVLARKAGAVGRPELLANWLYGVATRIAVRARAAAARRRSRERQVSAMPAVAAPPQVPSDLRPVLDEELARLGPKYRAPVVLCYLEGKSTEEAARQLGCPRGTVLSRLARAREQLRRRLVRRGVAMSVAALAAVLCRDGLAEGVPAAVADAAVRAALAGAAGQAAVAGSVPASVALANEVIRAMFLTKVKTAVLVLTAAGVLGTGALVGIREVRADKPPAAKQPAAPPGGKEADRTKGDKEKLLGTWELTAAEAQGRAAGDEVKLQRMVFKPDKMTTVKADGTEHEQTWTIDPKAKPKAIDIVPQDGPPTEKGQTFKGIYSLEGDALKICMAGPNMERPTEFTTKEGSPSMLLTFKRQPPEK